MIKKYICLSLLLFTLFPVFSLDIDTFTNNGFGFEYKEEYLYDYNMFIKDYPNIIGTHEGVIDEKSKVLQLEYENYYVNYLITNNSKSEKYLFRSVWAKEGTVYNGVFIGQDYLELANMLNINISKEQRYIFNHSKIGHDITIYISNAGKVEGIYWDYSLE